MASARIAVLVDHEESRRRLATWLREETDYEPVVLTEDREGAQAPPLDPSSSASRPPGDCCLVDPPALEANREWLAACKDAARPGFYPVVALCADGERPFEASLWDVADAAVARPFEPTVLRRRLRNLLERRRRTRRLETDRVRAERRYEAVLEAVDDAVLLVDAAMDRILDCNARAVETFGDSRSALLSSSVHDLFAADEDTCRDFLETVLSGDRSRTESIACRRPDGTRIEADVFASVVADDGDGPVMVCIRDVTERRGRERLVERQRDRLAELNRITQTLNETTRAVVEASTREELEAAVCCRLADSDVYQFAWIGEPGADDEAVASRAAAGDAAAYLERVRVTTDDAATGRGPTGRALRTGEVQVVPNVAAADRMEPWRDALDAFDVRATAAVPITNDGDTYGVLNLYTARRDAFGEEERAVLAHLGRTIGRAIVGIRAREDAQLFREAVEHAGHAIYITGTDGTIEYVNPAFEERTGYDRTEAIGRTPRILKSGEHDGSFYRDLWTTILSGDVWEREVVNRRKDGRRQHVDQTIAPIFGEGDDVEHFVAVNTDITAQRRQQQQLQVLYRVLRHNLRNELNVVDGYLDLVADGDLDADARAAVEHISTAVDELLKIGTQARQIESAFADDGPVGEMHSLERVVRNAIDDARNAEPIEGVDATVETSIPDTPYRVSAELGTAVAEVLTNAIQHTDAARPCVSLAVDTHVEDGVPWATVSVRDDGPGIPETERTVLQEGRETPLYHGSGLGLWLVNWIVSELGGRVEIDVPDAAGTHVSLHLPVSE